MLYKEIRRIDGAKEYRPLKNKRDILRETTRAIAEFNMSEISEEDMIMPREIIEGVTLGLMREILKKVDEDLPK